MSQHMDIGQSTNSLYIIVDTKIASHYPQLNNQRDMDKANFISGNSNQEALKEAG